MKQTLSQIHSDFKKLSMHRYTCYVILINAALVVLTTLSGAAMAPVSLDVPLLFWTSLGTGLCSASANTFNQVRILQYIIL